MRHVRYADFVVYAMINANSHSGRVRLLVFAVEHLGCLAEEVTC